MLLNYDFLEFENGKTENRTRDYSLTKAIDKELEAKRLAKSTRPRLKVKEGLSLRATLDAFGEELSRLKREQNTQTIKGSTIESASLNRIVNKIKSGLPFGTISAFRPFKPAFEKDFTKDERDLLIEAYKSGYSKADADKIAKLWQDKSAKIDLHKPIKAKDFFKGNTNIYRTLRNLFGQKFMDSYIAPKSETTMKDLMSSKEFVERYRYTQKDNMERTQQLKRLLDSKRDFIGYIQVIGYWKESLKDDLIPDKETSFFVFVNEPSSTFSLKNHLLLLAQLFNQAAICYCDNAKTGKVDLLLATQKDFGKVDMTFTGITFTAPLTNSITRLHNKVYTFFKKQDKDNYGVFFDELGKTQIKAMSIQKNNDGFYRHLENGIKSFIKARQYHGSPRTFDVDDIEKYELQTIKERENRKKVLNASFRQSYENALKLNKVVKAMRQGKKVSKTLIAKVLANTIDTDAGYCFISDLATQLGNISPRLSKSIVTAIEQAQGIRLNYALIDKITYNSLHNILSFIFDIDNPLSDQALEELVIEVPREALKNVKLPQIKNVLSAQIFDGAYHFKS